MVKIYNFMLFNNFTGTKTKKENHCSILYFLYSALQKPQTSIIFSEILYYRPKCYIIAKQKENDLKRLYLANTCIKLQ